jgi:hypothetical protein
MAERFDPYYKWLGIPPKDQPPNHYRLLGLELFESDPEVIDAAANRQMAYVHEAATGEYFKESQRILNELAAARRCLLDAQKKAAYDETLQPSVPDKVRRNAQRRRRREVVPPPPPQPAGPEIAPPPAPPEAAPLELAPPWGGPAIGLAGSKLGARPAQRRSQAGWIVAAVLSLGVLAGAAWVLYQSMTSAGAPANGSGGTQVASAPGTLPRLPTQAGKAGSRGKASQRPDPSSPKGPGDDPAGPSGANSSDASGELPGAAPPSAGGPSTSPDRGSSAPPPLSAARREELDRLLADARAAIDRQDALRAIELLEMYVADPGAPELLTANQLLEQTRYVISDAIAQAALAKMNQQQLDALANDQLMLNTDLTHSALVEILKVTLKRNLPKELQRRAGNPASTAPTEPAVSTEPPGTPAENLPDPATEPDKYLAARGLKNDKGAKWLLGMEADLLERVGPLKDLEKTYKEKERAFSDALRFFDGKKAELAAAERRLQQLQNLRQPVPPQLSAFIQEWKPKVGTPEAIAASDKVVGPLREQIAARDELLLATLAVKPLAEKTQALYAELDGDTHVAEAFAKLPPFNGAAHRLAASPQYKKELETFLKLEKSLLADQTLIYREGDKFRICCVVNEKVPAAFYHEAGFQELTIVPDAIVKAAGLQPNTSVTNTLSFGEGGRMIPCHPVKIDTLRVGRHVFKDIQGLAAPAEAADLGFVIPASLFQEYRTEMDKDKFIMTIRPKGEDNAAAKGGKK